LKATQKYVIEDEEEDASSYWMTLKKREILKVQRGSARSHSLESSLWKRYEPAGRSTKS
jgi:hypothetical protein